MAFGLSAGAATLVAGIGGAAVSAGLSSVLNKGSNRAAERANNSAADATMLTAEIGAEQWDRYKEMYSPLESEFVADAQNYDSPTQYQRAAGDASSTVSQQFGKARDRLGRTPGLDPSAPAFTSAMTGLDIAQAATDATQQNAARQKVKDTAYVRKTDALSLGKGLPAQASNMLSTATRSNLGLADLNNASSMYNSQALGNVVNRVINPTNVKNFSNWLNTPSVPSMATVMSSNGGWGSGNDYGNKDLALGL